MVHIPVIRPFVFGCTVLLLLAAPVLPAAAAPTEIVPVRMVNGEGPGAVPRGLFSDGTLRVAIELDRDAARLVGYTVAKTPFVRDAAAPEARAGLASGTFQIEVVLLGPDERRFTRRFDVGPICLNHPSWAEPHVEGDTIVGHRETVVTELPDLEGFRRVEVAAYPSVAEGTRRKTLVSQGLAETPFVPLGEETPHEITAVGAEEGIVGAAEGTSGAVLWPESFGDPDRYRDFGNALERNRRTSIVIVPDGYTYSEKAAMGSHAEALVGTFRAKTPFKEHDRFLNYVLIYAYSVESGTDQCDCGISRNTAMATYFPRDVATCGDNRNRCLYYGSPCDTNSSTNLALAELRVPGFDYAMGDRTIVMVNTTRYGGCGGFRAVYAAGSVSATEIAIHELGHSIAGLDDEYEGYSSCGSWAGEINTSLDPVDGAWPEWIPDVGAPRAGARYYSQCVYRPQATCEMRALSQPFCPVCAQRLSLVFFEKPRVAPTAPVESFSPVSPLASSVGAPLTFSVATRLASGPLVTNQISWEIQGPGDPAPVVVATAGESLTRAFDRPGTFVVTCRVRADTNFIRAPQTGAHVDQATWNVSVTLSRPLEVAGPGSSQPLRFASRDALVWEDGSRSRSTRFDVYRSKLPRIRTGWYGVCLARGLTASTVTDPSVPSAGVGFTYLVAGWNAAGEGTLGTDSAGGARIPGVSCAP